MWSWLPPAASAAPLTWTTSLRKSSFNAAGSNWQSQGIGQDGLPERLPLLFWAYLHGSMFAPDMKLSSFIGEQNKKKSKITQNFENT